MSEWQPIETAPKDDLDDDGNAVPVILGWWSLEATPTWQWVLAEWTGEEWEAVGAPSYCEIGHCTPTHWMRPTQPPVQSGQGNNRHSQDSVGGTELRPRMAGGGE